MKKSIISGLAGFLLVSSCAGAPAAGQQAPAWVTSTPPREEAGSYVFVVRGMSERGNETEAEGIAGTSLQQAIVQEFGVRITATTTAREIGSVDELRRELDNVVQSRSSARIRGLRIADRFVSKSGSSVTVFIKALYEKTEFDAEKARVQAIFREQQEAVSGPEREGDALRDDGKFFQAVEKYIQAAKASIDGVTGGELDNAEIKYNRNMNKAREILTAMNIVSDMESQETTVGTAFPRPFTVRVVHGNDSTPVSGVQLNFSYKIKRGNRVVSAGLTATTDREGRASFTHPTPNFAGREPVIITVDSGPVIELIGRVATRFRDQVDTLEEAAAKLRTTIMISVTSNARNVTMAVVIADTNASGGVVPGANGQVGLLAALNGWRAVAISAPPSALQGDTASVVQALRGAIGSRARLVFGTLTAGAASQVSGQFEVRAQGNVQVVDVATGEVLYSGSKVRSARNTTEASAASSALRQLGDIFGKDLADNLP